MGVRGCCAPRPARRPSSPPVPLTPPRAGPSRTTHEICGLSRYCICLAVFAQGFEDGRCGVCIAGCARGEGDGTGGMFSRRDVPQHSEAQERYHTGKQSAKRATGGFASRRAATRYPPARFSCSPRGISHRQRTCVFGPNVYSAIDLTGAPEWGTCPRNRLNGLFEFGETRRKYLGHILGVVSAQTGVADNAPGTDCGRLET